MMECWRRCAENRPNLNSVHSAVSGIRNMYAVMQSTVPNAANALNGNTNYSTFGKDLRPPLTVESAVECSSHHKCRRSLSQKNTSQSDRLSITFSVLSDDSYLDQSSEDETEGLEEREVSVDNSPYLTGKQHCEGEPYSPTLCTDVLPSSFPMNGVSTFLAGPTAPCSLLNDADIPGDASSFDLPHATAGRHHSHAPPISPLNATVPITDHSQNVTHTEVPSGKLLRPVVQASDTLLPPNSPSYSYNSDSATTPSILVAKSDSESVSKASTLDSITNFVSGSGRNHNTPSSHILGLPSNTYSSTSVSIDDVKLRNKTLLMANGQMAVSAASTTPSGTSKSDSGIRSDEEVDLMLSNGCPPPPPEVAPKRVSNGSMVRPASSRAVSGVSLGISDLSSDLMSAFASWGK